VTKENPIPRAVLWLRDQDSKLGKNIRYLKYKTPWDIDWISLRCRDNDQVMSIELNGKKVSITTDRYRKIGNELLIYVQDILLLQFCSKKDFNKILKVYESFGTCILTRYPDKSLDKVIDYCNKMDDQIVSMVNKLAEDGCKGIFDQVFRQMGGDNIRLDDRLGQRILFYKEITDRYKKNNSLYLQDMRNLKLLV